MGMVYPVFSGIVYGKDFNMFKFNFGTANIECSLGGKKHQFNFGYVGSFSLLDYGWVGSKEVRAFQYSNGFILGVTFKM